LCFLVLEEINDEGLDVFGLAREANEKILILRPAIHVKVIHIIRRRWKRQVQLRTV